jgi:hypothetical protein
MAIISAMPKVVEVKNNFLSRLLIFKNNPAKKIKERKTAMITICPASNPRLKANKGKVKFSSLPNIDFSKVEKPIPWINPKKRANPYFTIELFFFLTSKLKKLKMQVPRMVIGIKNSIMFVEILIKLITLRVSVTLCPIVKEVTIKNNSFFDL